MNTLTSSVWLGAARSGRALAATVIGSLLCLSQTVVAYSSVAEGSVRLADIIRNVRENEDLYENREVIGDIAFRRVSAVERGFESIDLTAGNERFRHVAQNALIYLEIRGKQRTSTAESLTDVLEGYDGERTVVCEGGGSASIDRGARHEHPQIFRPHTVLLYSEFVSYPLSTFLSGRDAILAHPHGSGFQSNPFEVSYLGEEQVGGLRCHKVVADFYWSSRGEKPKKVVRRFLWLAPTRNYLPVRQMCYELGISADIETEEGVLEDLREIAPGVWFPFSAHDTAHDKQVIVSDKRRVVAWKRSWTIKNASLDPKYDIGLFRDIAIPEGIPVSQLENGRFLRSFVSGSRDDPDAATRVPGAGLSHPIRLALTLASVGAFAAFLLLWWLRKKARVAAQPTGARRLF